MGKKLAETDKTETDTADTVDQLSNISSDIGSDSELSDGEDYDNESDVSEPPIILDSDDEAPALPVKYASTMTPARASTTDYSTHKGGIDSTWSSTGSSDDRE